MQTGKRGFTLVELLLALMVTVPALLTLMGLIAYNTRVAETSRGIMAAMQDAHTVIERMRDVSEQGLDQVTTTYPDGEAVAGFASLPNEQIIVDYTDTGVDPLAVTVTVTWRDRNRLMTRALTTQITQR